jgi:hypothetical protein
MQILIKIPVYFLQRFFCLSSYLYNMKTITVLFHIYLHTLLFYSNLYVLDFIKNKLK